MKLKENFKMTNNKDLFTDNESNEKSVSDCTLVTLAALIEGDRWLSADSCAVFFGLVVARGKPNAGRPNRRGFLERVATRPSFPKPLVIGNEKKWNKSEITRWAKDQQRLSRAS